MKLFNRKGTLLKALEIVFAIPIIITALVLFYIWISKAGIESSSSIFGSSAAIELDYRFVDRMNLYSDSLFVTKDKKLPAKLTFDDTEKTIALFFKCGDFFEVADGEFDCPKIFQMEKNVPSLVCDNLFLGKTTVPKKPVITNPRGVDKDKMNIYNKQFFVPGPDAQISKVKIKARVAPYVRELTDEVYCE